MAEGVIADTCIWIEYFRGETVISKKLEVLIPKGIVYTCGIVLYELFQGIRNLNEKALLEEVFKGLAYVEISRQTWLNAAILAKNLKRKGTSLPPSDIFLAQLAIENNLKIFTIDMHFKKIPGVAIL